MAVTVTIRAHLKGDISAMQAVHDRVTGATREMAIKAGDISHHVYLGAQDSREFLGIDVWQSSEQADAFASDPRIQEFFGELFEGPPEVSVWADPGWNQW